jgi:hypothetical protein
MNKEWAFAKLDWLTIKPYVAGKPLITLAIILCIIVISRSGGAIMGSCWMLVFMLGPYPFALSDKSNLDAMYITLGIDRRTVIKGRYLFMLLEDAVCCVLSLALGLAATLLDSTFTPQEAIITMAVLFVVFFILQCAQLPIYFKVGYANGKIMTILPLMLVVAVMVLMGTTFGDTLSSFFDTLFAFPVLSVAAAVICICAIGYVSYRLSLRFYTRREF